MPKGKALIIATTAALFLGAMAGSSDADAADARHFSFGYDQPHTTGYGVAADLFGNKLAELSKNTLVTDQFPGAQLGQEPQMLQKIRTGDIDIMISSFANAATLTPEAGVMSIQYVFQSDEHLMKALADPGVVTAVKKMVSDTVTGGHVLALATLGLRQLYGKKPIRKLDDIRNVKVRVQATKTEDTIFPAYGAQTVHMPFGDVYTALQTGLVDMAENGLNVYLANKHYEAAPVISLTSHEANNSLIWVSDKAWNSLTPEQQGWVQAAADEVGSKQPALAIKLEKESAARLEKMGVQVVRDVDQSGFIKIAEPIQDQLAKELGPHAVEILQLCRALR
jgi:tripartite ATP-independent transporter DctP family solute receptor